jgi:peptidoglycan/LPS O-acetylase OafA/YrhL
MHRNRMLGLEALRAFAVMAVLASHFPLAGPGFAAPSTLGAAGVNAFFALSGYLVGGIALRDIRSPADILPFWRRRWLRTIPPAAVVAVLVFVIWQFSATDLLRLLTFTRHISGMSGGPPEHYWSLAVEEWFYLLLPGLVLLLGRAREPLPWLVALWLAIVLLREGSLALEAITSDAAHNGTFFRFDALLAGVIAVTFAPHLRSPAPFAWFGATAAVIAHVVPLIEPALSSLALNTMAPAAFAATLPALAQWRPAGSSLMWKAALHIAAISYALYLVHLPVYVFCAAAVPEGWARAASALLLTWLLAVCLRRYVELPVLSWRDRTPAPVPACP